MTSVQKKPYRSCIGISIKDMMRNQSNVHQGIDGDIYKTLPLAKTWVDLKDIVFETCEAQKKKYLKVTLLCGI